MEKWKNEEEKNGSVVLHTLEKKKSRENEELKEKKGGNRVKKKMGRKKRKENVERLTLPTLLKPGSRKFKRKRKK